MAEIWVPSGTSRKPSIWAHMWSWWVVGVLCPSLVGLGWASMTGHPWVADGFFAVAALIFICKFWTWEEAKKERGKGLAIQILASSVTLALCIWVCLWNHRINAATVISAAVPASPAPSIPRSLGHLTITHFDRGPYAAGKPVLVNVHFRYEGLDPVRAKGYYKVGMLHWPKEITQQELLKELPKQEDSIWAALVAEVGNSDAVEQVFSPGQTPWVTALGPPLSADDIHALSIGTAAVLLLGGFTWQEGNFIYEVDYCTLNQADPRVFVVCNDHNGPAAKVVLGVPPPARTTVPATPPAIPAAPSAPTAPQTGSVGVSLDGTTGAIVGVEIDDVSGFHTGAEIKGNVRDAKVKNIKRYQTPKQNPPK